MKVMQIFHLILFFFVTSTVAINACTGIKLVTKDGSTVNGRTLEFGIFVETSVMVVPRGYLFKGTTPDGPGLSYRAKYAALGAIAYDNPAILDGINEKGLSVGTFYFPGFASYANTTPANQSRGLSPVDFPNWILTQFATLEEVKQALPSIIVTPTVVKEWGNEPAPFHYIVYDKMGRSLVIEPLNGKLKTYDNPLGTMTNSPTFDWHLTNLRNYINLTPFNAKPITIDGQLFAPFGQGSGMVGLPGDFTPPSRFVRAAIFTLTATPSANSNEAVFQLFHILNQFDIPVGAIKAKENGMIHSDFTLVTSVKDPQTLKYYFKTYDNQSIQVVDLKKFDFNADTVRIAKTSGRGDVIDLTSELKPLKAP